MILAIHGRRRHGRDLEFYVSSRMTSMHVSKRCACTMSRVQWLFWTATCSRRRVACAKGSAQYPRECERLVDLHIFGPKYVKSCYGS
jgi:hypothetical protein